MSTLALRAERLAGAVGGGFGRQGGGVVEREVAVQSEGSHLRAQKHCGDLVAEDLDYLTYFHTVS